MSNNNYLFIKIFKELKKNIKSDINENTIYKIRVIDNTIRAINNFNKKITLDNYKEFENIKGIGKKTIDKMKEILITGSLQSLSNNNELDNDANKKKKLIDELKKIIGIGNTIAINFIKKGILSITDLETKIKNKEIEVNDKIKLGLKYHNKFIGNIPRTEIDIIKTKLDNIIKKLNIHNKNDEKFILKICGSYRRLKETSGDIDLLLSKKNNETINNYLKIFINKLKENNLLVDDITYKNYKTKYMGFLKYNDYPIRRIDILFVSWSSYYYSLLYFTGSMIFNTELRQIAKNKGYRLTEYSLYDINTNNKVNIKINSEKDIFNFLNIKYLKPKDR